MSEDARDIIRGVSRVASLPEIFMRVEETLARENSSARDLARIIEEDSALTARLLRFANSPIYGLGTRVETVQSAITVLGMEQVRELVLACSVLRVFAGIDSDSLNMEQFWRHSIACGVMARAIGSLRGEHDVERLLVGGLLHDIGRLVLLMERPRAMSRVMARARDENMLLHEAERLEFGFDHAYLGGMLLRKWKLPPRLIESVAFHHLPLQARDYPDDAAIIHVADIIINSLALGSSGQRFVPPLDDAAWTRLDISLDRLGFLLKVLDQQYQDAVSFVLGK